MIKQLLFVMILLILVCVIYNKLYFSQKNNLTKLKINSSLIEFNKMRKEIDKMLEISLSEDIKDVNLLNLTKYSMDGGKRVRGIIISSIVFKNMKNKNPIIIKAVNNAILCIEYIHCSSLILDDIMDEDCIRRKKPSLYSKYGIPMAQLTALNLLSLAFKRLIIYIESIQSLNGVNPNLPFLVLNELSEKLNKLAMGQYFDVINSNDLPKIGKVIKNNLKMSTEEIIKNKTSSLFELSYFMSLIIIKYTKSNEELLKSYQEVTKVADSFGMIFQIADDFEDLEQDKIHNGKNIIMNYPLNKGLVTGYTDYHKYVDQFNKLSNKLNMNTEQIKEIVLYLSEKVNKYYKFHLKK